MLQGTQFGQQHKARMRFVLVVHTSQTDYKRTCCMNNAWQQRSPIVGPILTHTVGRPKRQRMVSFSSSPDMQAA